MIINIKGTINHIKTKNMRIVLKKARKCAKICIQIFCVNLKNYKILFAKYIGQKITNFTN